MIRTFPMAKGSSGAQEPDTSDTKCKICETLDMIASVHLVDSNPVRNFARRRPKAGAVDGLRWSRKALCGQFSPGAMPDAQIGRGGFVAWWDDDAALDAFEASHPLAVPYRDGWSVRLRPTRSRAAWPGADFDPFPGPNERHDGTHAAVTLGTALIPRFPRFMRASSPLDDQFVADPNGIWGIAITFPPRTVMTLTFWTDQDATDGFVRSGAHGEAMRAHYDFKTDSHEFISDGGFFGFEPYRMRGSLTGKNATPAGFSA